MENNETLGNARFIFNTGRKVHDNITRIITAVAMEKGKASQFGELSYQQKNMIMMIRVRECVSVTELSGILNVSPPSVSAMVDRLVERGLLIRTHSEKDRRKVEIRVAPAAVDEIALVEEKLLNSFLELTQLLGPEITSQWCSVLQQIEKLIEEGLWPSKNLLSEVANE
ncbi:MAG: MarR family transcriptional regulator [Desulfobacterales bacterium]|nr:MarR family transcriptional regulator [Desulfobacterales bacterium]